MTVNREASGTAHANLYYVEVKGNEEVMVELALDTADTEHQKEIVVNEMNFMNKNGEVCQQTLETLPFIEVFVVYEKTDLGYLYEGFEILDKKLPLAYVMNQLMIASVAISGYHVGIETLLLKYLEA